VSGERPLMPLSARFRKFDEGADELLRIQNGGCHPEDGCSDPELPFQGADFQYLSAKAFEVA